MFLHFIGYLILLNNGQGHFDGVIHHFREMHVTSWPDVFGLPSLVDRLRSLCPTPHTQTHILHLASNGEILPHVDSPGASGSWILGVSLGAERIMHMVDLKDSNISYDVLLPSGSVYLQKYAKVHCLDKLSHNPLAFQGHSPVWL